MTSIAFYTESLCLFEVLINGHSDREAHCMHTTHVGETHAPVNLIIHTTAQTFVILNICCETFQLLHKLQVNSFRQLARKHYFNSQKGKLVS